MFTKMTTTKSYITLIGLINDESYVVGLDNIEYVKFYPIYEKASVYLNSGEEIECNLTRDNYIKLLTGETK